MISVLYIFATVVLHAIGAFLFAPGHLFLSILTAIFLFLAWLVSPGRDLGRVFVGEKRVALLFVAVVVFFFVIYAPSGLMIYECLSWGVWAGSGFLLFYAVGFRTLRWAGFEGVETGNGTDRGLGSLMASSSSPWPLNGSVKREGRAEELGLRAGRYFAELRQRVRRLFC